MATATPALRHGHNHRALTPWPHATRRVAATERYRHATRRVAAETSPQHTEAGVIAFIFICTKSNIAALIWPRVRWARMRRRRIAFWQSGS